MKIAIFAHYDKDNLIDSYVVDYLTELKLFVNQIVFVSDSNLLKDELEKISHLVNISIAEKHGEYDFGSYKRGFLAVENKLESCDHLIFCNDSCYLIGSLKPIFDSIDGDFFGLIKNTDNFPVHLQSYFLVFNNTVFLSEVFSDFVKSIKQIPKKVDLIEAYEVGLTQLLLKAGFNVHCFIEEEFKSNPTMSEDFFKKLLPLGFPFLKTELLKTNLNNLTNLMRWKTNLSAVSIKTIDNHITRMIGSNRKHWKYSKLISFLGRKPKNIFLRILSKIFYIQVKKGKVRIILLGMNIFKFSI